MWIKALMKPKSMLQQTLTYYTKLLSKCFIAFFKINKEEFENMTSRGVSLINFKVSGNVMRHISSIKSKLLTIPVQKCPPVSSPSVHPVRFSWQKPFPVPLESHGSQTRPFCFLNQTKLGKNCTISEEFLVCPSLLSNAPQAYM